MIILLGIVAGIITTSSFIPQLVKSWRTRHTKDLSLPMYLTLDLGIILWFLYGILTNDLPVLLANGVAFILSTTIIILKIRYK
ncbi:MAG: SemiSWEET transporter [Candidatus Chisholmbacteria bacterium]|nr:SemiSWEET transporter [Candidatus Chisholmbacteria bacterium]